MSKVELADNLIRREFICKKGQARMLGHLLRTLTVASSPSWRPIAIDLDKPGTNVLHSSGDVIQSMLDVRQAFAGLQFDIVGDTTSDIVIETYRFSGVLMSDDLNTNRVKCLTPGVNIINMLNDSEVTIKVYFRKAYGSCDLEENQNAIQKGEQINTLGNINVIASVHTENDQFTYVVEDNSLDTEKLIVGLNNKYNTMDEAKCDKLLNEILSSAIDTLQNMQGQL